CRAGAMLLPKRHLVVGDGHVEAGGVVAARGGGRHVERTADAEGGGTGRAQRAAEGPGRRRLGQGDRQVVRAVAHVDGRGNRDREALAALAADGVGRASGGGGGQ